MRYVQREIWRLWWGQRNWGSVMLSVALCHKMKFWMFHHPSDHSFFLDPKYNSIYVHSYEHITKPTVKRCVFLWWLSRTLQFDSYPLCSAPESQSGLSTRVLARFASQTLISNSITPNRGKKIKSWKPIHHTHTHSQRPSSTITHSIASRIYTNTPSPTLIFVTDVTKKY